MRKFMILILSIVVVLSLTMIAAVNDQAAAQVAGQTKIYNLFATDGYYQLPDGQPLYIYGFIGGVQDPNVLTFTYQKRCIPSKKDKVTGLSFCTQQGNGTLTSITPTGGPVTPAEQAFAGQAQFPAPVIYAAVGDVVEIRLKNLGVSANLLAPNDPHSIHLHGLDVDAANDGVPETSLGAVPANLCADGTTAAPGVPCAAGAAPGAGNVIVYMFTPTHAGTYMYHCHQEADIHVQMGMFGALVVYEPGDAAAATGPGSGAGGVLYGHPYDKDYVMLVSEFDVRGHASEEGTYKPNVWDPNPYNWALYQPQYWSVNGISFPQTIHAAFPVKPGGVAYTYTEWLTAHPGYETLYTGSVSGGSGAWGTPGEKVLLRVINMGFQTHPLHMHGYHGKIIGSDQRAWPWANQGQSLTGGAWNTLLSPWGTGGTPFNEGLEKNTLTIGSGETYDWLVDFGQQSFQSVYPAGTMSRTNNTTNPVTGLLTNVPCDPTKPLNAPMPNTATGCAPIPDFGNPLNAGTLDYIGGPTVTGLVGHPDASQYFPFHNHDDYKATNNGVYPGGMFTMLVPIP